jgi:hypothetical protein
MNCKYCGKKVEHPYRYDSSGEYWHIGCEEGYPPVIEDVINNPIKPGYYNKEGMDVFNIMDQFFPLEQQIGFCRGSMLKYLLRYREKGGIQDLEKAGEYAIKLLELEKKRSE